MHPEIGFKWHQLNRDRFGYPVIDEQTKPDGRGRFVDFRAIHLKSKPLSAIYFLPEIGAAHEIFGAILEKWIQIGAERSRLGYPVSGEQDQGLGRLQRFQGGSIFWTRQGGAIVQ